MWYRSLVIYSDTVPVFAPSGGRQPHSALRSKNGWDLVVDNGPGKPAIVLDIILFTSEHKETCGKHMHFLQQMHL